MADDFLKQDHNQPEEKKMFADKRMNVVLIVVGVIAVAVIAAMAIYAFS